VIPATVGALIQELVDLATILAALRALGGRLGVRGSAAKSAQSDQGTATGAGIAD
jgi:hypothetical protein